MHCMGFPPSLFKAWRAITQHFGVLQFFHFYNCFTKLLLPLCGSLHPEALLSVPTQESAWAGPLILLSLAFAAAFLGYYQLFYLPSVAPTTGPSTGPTPFNVTVNIVFGAQNPSQNQNFVPNNVTLVLGNNSTVIWVNKDSTVHTATGDHQEFDTGSIPFGSSAEIRFAKPGTYSYFCTFHPFMKGIVLVKPAPTTQKVPPEATGFGPLNLASLLQGFLRALSALAGLPGA